MNEFITKCKDIVAGYIGDTNISKDEIFVVWSCKTLGNNKALLSTNVPDGMYYEITHNGAKKEIYFDAYKKWENKCIKMEE